MVLPPVAANAAIARQALAGLTDHLDVDAASAAELRVSITAAWADAIHTRAPGDEPVEVTMRIDRDQLVLRVGRAAPGPWSPTGIVLALAPGRYVAAVLGRVVSLVSARVGFSIDRLSDAQIVSDAIAGSAATHAPGGIVRVRIEEHGHGFELIVGPLAPGGGDRMLTATELPGLGSLLARLVDRLEVERHGTGEQELLRVCLERPPHLRVLPSGPSMFEP
jgi:anti-sigma regulatory factor (Ser/Thr protein kinase)